MCEVSFFVLHVFKAILFTQKGRGYIKQFSYWKKWVRFFQVITFFLTRGIRLNFVSHFSLLLSNFLSKRPESILPNESSDPGEGKEGAGENVSKSDFPPNLIGSHFTVIETRDSLRLGGFQSLCEVSFTPSGCCLSVFIVFSFDS